MSGNDFFREFTKLNPAQQKAVKSIEGPIMVLAGPGTGKTQVVAMRIANILNKTQISARNILALTFTEAGVTALKQRLEAIIGPDAYQVTISTFHGFANEIINTFLYVFPQVSSGENLSELEQYQIFDRLIAKNAKLKELRPPRASERHVAAIISTIKQLKQENITPTQLKLLCRQDYQQSLKAKLSAEKTEALAMMLRRNLELAEIYRDYIAYLGRHGLYDYEDMILLAIEAMRTHSEVKSYLQERYQYVLVDEYQDTNSAQNTLVELLCDFFESPNFFAVGDDKQAIYRFQGASVANMLHFANKYTDIKTVVLKENYRSSAAVLESATKLIEHNQAQIAKYLDLNLEVTAVSKKTNIPQLLAFPTHQTQYEWIIRSIQQQLTKRVVTGLNEVAVLFRTNGEVAEFRSLAVRQGLTVAGATNLNLLHEPKVKALLTVLGALSKPDDPSTLILALRFLNEKLTLVEISQAARAYRGRLSLAALMEQSEFRQVKVAADKLFALEQLSLKVSLVSLVLETVLVLGLVDSQEPIGSLETVGSFVEQVKKLVNRQPTLGLDRLVEHFELLRRYKLTIPITQAMPERTSLFVGTVHSAKGLEFKTVFMPNVSEDSWRLRANRSIVKLPSAISGLKDWQDDPIDDERRLFFVAMTRTSGALFLTYSQTRVNGNPNLPCQFVSEINLEPKIIKPSESEVRQALTQPFNRVTSSVLKQQELEYVREHILATPFSFTHFQSYLACPRRYLLRHVLGLPEAPNYNLIFGSAVHRALELIGKRQIAQKSLPNKDVLIGFFRESVRGDLPEAELTLMKDRGAALLGNYFDSRLSEFMAPIAVEYNFQSHHVLLDDIWLTGKFDRIEPIDPVAKTVRVIDFKTGSRPKTRGQIEGTTKDSEGEIKQQLTFYALLSRLDRQFPYHVSELTVRFIDDAGKFSEESFSVGTEEILKLTAQIKETHTEILTLTDFQHNEINGFERGCELCALF
ncbi:hypothetical protein A3A71_02145 [Candidatus Berkelbacteria bacterium RIFCSPLOWO2_01_FULL_50_28]|uniref:DNA 3'-5' helicase n=1 Tax=Candidatus Berkelbacteria bacterium RIFCSPLOWO2_01_FULL_50_28 TaxID=1797471 RepID=A0A1F5EBR2_9BACT|nr:MAG: hypothetical protein A2807_00540 [Candidatus Berkelbacteria bacterium RIFCSPHIGHO2_01_FULL_50_36]OGD64825.1 MAG: hypothetical protein A3A71_02145 [Candidatus Berkelbacteria bacterium RIFCSPLOWO2_01_FULL_50_28]